MLENMKLLGKGNTAEVFDYGNKRVCKLFYEGYPDKYVALEFRNSKEMQNKVPSALSTPLPLTHEGFWGFPLSLFVVKYSYV